MRRGPGPLPGRKPARRRTIVLVVALLLVAVCPRVARATNVNGSAVVSTTTTDDQSLETRYVEQKYNLSLFQPITPYLSLQLAFRYYDFSAETDPGLDFDRRTVEPRVNLLYDRERLSARLSYYDRNSDGSAANDNFESKSFLASVSWRPVDKPGFTATYRDESNAVDTALLGRDSQSTYLNLETFYNRSWGGVSYGFQRTNVDSRSSGFSTLQNRHELRAYATHPLLEDRLTLDFSAAASRLDRKSVVSDQFGFVEIVPPREGLYAVDTSPDIGELQSAPDLIDTDVATPAAPGIEIGGANTYRNVGLDLGLTTQVSRLEITVDTVSGPSVAWQVYHSQDNLAWERVGGEIPDFDSVFLRYTIRFPETTARYFKAVNVSANTVTAVSVTEVRALLDRTDPIETSSSRQDSTRYRADAAATYRPNDRVTSRFELAASNDQDVVAGLVRRDFRALHAGARVAVDLSRDLQFSAGYRYDDTENRRTPALLRTESVYSAGLRWTPLATLDAFVTAQRRDEYERSDLLQSNRSARMLVSMDLLPDLRLISDLSFVTLVDPVGGFDRSGLTWSQAIEAQPAQRWTLRVRYGASSYESPDGSPVLDRSELELQSTWAPTPYLSMFGSWAVFRDLSQDNLRQNYGLTYTPGRKLRVTAAYQEYSTQEALATDTSSVDVGYRLGRKASIFGNLTRSRSRVEDVETARITSARAGLRVFF